MTKKKPTKVKPSEVIEKVKKDIVVEKVHKKASKKTPKKEYISGKEILSKKTVIINGKKYEELSLADGSKTLK